MTPWLGEADDLRGYDAEGDARGFALTLLVGALFAAGLAVAAWLGWL